MAKDGTAREAVASTLGTPQRIRLRDILAEAREIIIEHDGQEYRLRITSRGKLILTK
jgi:hemin uptake protein HemP